MIQFSDLISFSSLMSTLGTATIVILAGLGCLMTEKSGMMNIGLDGIITGSGFVAAVVSWAADSWALGLLAGLGTGLILGLFSTAGDMAELCRAILRGEVISREDLRDMARNRTGRPLPGGGWTQHLGLLCYVRHPVQYHSEVPVYMSGGTIALSGFTGNHIAVDPERGLFEFYLGSRVMDRLTVLIPPPGKSVTDYGLSADGIAGEKTQKLLFSDEAQRISQETIAKMVNAALIESPISLQAFSIFFLTSASNLKFTFTVCAMIITSFRLDYKFK